LNSFFVFERLKKEQLRSLSAILGLSSSGRNTDLAEKILNFLMKPVDEGKKIPSKKQTKKRDSKPKENGKDFHFKPGKNPTNKQVSDHEEDLTDANEQQGSFVFSFANFNQIPLSCFS